MKKIISVLMVSFVFVVVMFSSNALAYDTQMSIESENSDNGTLRYNLSTDRAVSGLLLCAVYDDNGTLIGVAADNSRYAKTEWSVSARLSKESGFSKLMLWNTLEGLTPLAEPIIREWTAESSDSNALVAYFTAAENFDTTADAVSSATGYIGSDGEAGYIAKIIADKTGADLFSIRTEKKYPAGYDDLANEAKAQQDRGELPKLSTHIINPDKYDTVFVVHPVWWYDIPQVMYSFFDEYDFSGKTIIPVTTHAGSRSTGPASIEKIEPNATVRKDLHLAISSGTEETSVNTAVDEWLTDTVKFEKNSKMTEYLNNTIETADGRLHYTYYLPANYDKNKTYNLIK